MPRKAPKLGVVGYDGKFEQGFMEVVDPFEGDSLKTITVAVNIKHDIVKNMFARRQIGEHQYRAGNKFLGIVQSSQACSGLAVDPTREPVDGSGDSTGILDNRLRAARELARIREFLGIRDYRIARFMICREPDAYQSPKSRWDNEYLNRRFREVLTDLAIYFQFMGKPRIVG
jgi:hypothetical protein